MTLFKNFFFLILQFKVTNIIRSKRFSQRSKIKNRQLWHGRWFLHKCHGNEVSFHGMSIFFLSCMMLHYAAITSVAVRTSTTRHRTWKACAATRADLRLDRLPYGINITQLILTRKQQTEKSDPICKSDLT